MPDAMAVTGICNHSCPGLRRGPKSGRTERPIPVIFGILT